MVCGFTVLCEIGHEGHEGQSVKSYGELTGNKCRMTRIPATFAEWKRLSRGVETANASET